MEIPANGRYLLTLSSWSDGHRATGELTWLPQQLPDKDHLQWQWAAGDQTDLDSAHLELVLPNLFNEQRQLTREHKQKKTVTTAATTDNFCFVLETN